MSKHYFYRYDLVMSYELQLKLVKWKGIIACGIRSEGCRARRSPSWQITTPSIDHTHHPSEISSQRPFRCNEPVQRHHEPCLSRSLPFRRTAQCNDNNLSFVNFTHGIWGLILFSHMIINSVVHINSVLQWCRFCRYCDLLLQ